MNSSAWTHTGVPFPSAGMPNTNTKFSWRTCSHLGVHWLATGYGCVSFPVGECCTEGKAQSRQVASLLSSAFLLSCILLYGDSRVCSQLEHSRAAFCGGDWELMYLHTFVPSLVFEGTFYFSGVTRRWVTEPHSGYISEFIRTCFCKLLLVGKRPFLAPLGTRMGSGPYNLSPRW